MIADNFKKSLLVIRFRAIGQIQFRVTTTNRESRLSGRYR